MTGHDDREGEVVTALVAMAGSLVTGAADVLELLTELTATCVRLLDVTAAGLLLADQRGALHVMGASSERAADLEAFQAQRAEGPCQDCYRDGRPVRISDLEGHLDRWPQFVPAARAAGFASVHAVPLRLRGDVLGALGLFGSSVGDLNDADLRLAQGGWRTSPASRWCRTAPRPTRLRSTSSCRRPCPAGWCWSRPGGW